MDQSLRWRRSSSHESHTPSRAYTGKDCPIRRHNPNFLVPLALSCTSRAAQHSRCFALQWLACVRMATSAQSLQKLNWLPASSAGYDAGSSCFPGRRLCTPQARARIAGLGGDWRNCKAAQAERANRVPRPDPPDMRCSSMPTSYDPRLPALRCTTSGWHTSSHQKFCLTQGSSLTRATFSRRFGVCFL